MLLSSSTTPSECNQTCCQHQRLLNEQLDWLTVDHDDLRQDILEQISSPKYHPSMAVIDKWEEKAIARIRDAAFLARRVLLDALDQHVLEVKKILNTLTPKLREARHHSKSFNENDIQEWATVLQEIKQMPVFSVIANKDNNIHGLTIDLRKEKRTHYSELKRDESTSPSLVSIILDDPTASTSTINRLEYQILPTNLTKTTDEDNNQIKFDNVSSNRSQTITPGGVLIVREQTKIKPPTTTRVRRGFDSSI